MSKEEEEGTVVACAAVFWTLCITTAAQRLGLREGPCLAWAFCQCPNPESTLVLFLPQVARQAQGTYSVRMESSWAIALSGSAGASPDGTLQSQR